MLEVSDVKDMERKLNQIRLDYYHLKVKLVVNMKRGKEVAVEKGKDAIEDVIAKEGIRLKELEVAPETILEMITMPLMPEGMVEERLSLKTDLLLKFTPKDNEVAWLKCSMVAVVRSLDMVKKI
ncbi:hypothetical protein SLEP1_g41050 [Rubroshorea leprosula]|uniref:Uncharacterized protein n=1 Tax=Rubroshorea leprosula TaxID=152421 RepID=A0AAV5L689_9ROSI|nr:hypothetical protein SLEP1_g41050 [Rubroshorea leprosula]